MCRCYNFQLCRPYRLRPCDDRFFQCILDTCRPFPGSRDGGSLWCCSTTKRVPYPSFLRTLLMFLLVSQDFPSYHGYIRVHVPRDWRTVVRRTGGPRCEVFRKDPGLERARSGSSDLERSYIIDAHAHRRCRWGRHFVNVPVRWAARLWFVPAFTGPSLPPFTYNAAPNR